MGEPVGATLQLAVAQGVVAAAGRERLGAARGGGGNQLVQAVPGVVGWRSGVVELPQLSLLIGGEQRQRRDLGVGVDGDPGEQGGEMPGHPLDGGRVEEVGVELQGGFEDPPVVGAVLTHLHGHVERGAALPDVYGLQRQLPGDGPGLGGLGGIGRMVGEVAGLFPGERHLEHRGAARVAGGRSRSTNSGNG